MRRISRAIQKEITQRLVKEFDPEAIYLFGSYAWGAPQPGSDLDLLVILKDSQQQPVQRAVRAQRSLRGIPAAVDVLVKTSSEVERYRNVYASPEFSDWFDVAETLTPYAAAYRYPGELLEPERAEFESALHMAKEL